MPALSRRVAPIDALLLLMTVIWGTNYAIVKHAFIDIDPQAFNALRMIVASSTFAAVMAWMHWRARARAAAGVAASAAVTTVFHSSAAVTGRDWLGLLGLGIVGQCLYQYLFRRRAVPDERREQCAAHRGDAGAHRAHDRGVRPGTGRLAALGGGRVVARRHLHRRRPGRAHRRQLASRRPDDDGGGRVLDHLYPRIEAADGAALAGRGHRPLDDHRLDVVRARGVVAPAVRFDLEMSRR